jgi:hypothetical protein
MIHGVHRWGFSFSRFRSIAATSITTYLLPSCASLPVTHERNPIDCATLRCWDRIPNVHCCLLDEVRKQTDCTGFELMLSPPISVPRAGPKWSIWSNQTFDFSYSWLRDSATAVLSSARSSTDGFIQDNPSLWTLDCGSLRIHWKEGINWINAGCFFFRYLCKLPLGSICRDCRWF